jgi:hypothetical protein
MMNTYLNSLNELKTLPVEVQKDVAEHLVNYNEVSVSRDNGRYSCFNGSCLCNRYAHDHKVWYFDKKTVQQIPELAEIIKRGEEEYERWCDNNDVNWDAL